MRKPLDLKIHVPVESMVEPGQSTAHADPLDPLQGGESTRNSIWPAIYPELLALVREHRSTIIFVNARRGAERLALRLNELAGEEIARAHHGSLAREERTVVEELLKAGELPCLVATSSLELGIDMGAVDLVLQVESPKSVASGLQRIGRAGHGVGDVSKGRIFPKFRADLVECAVVARMMRNGEIEPTVVPKNPLDVLAQQIVAMTAATDPEPIGVDELHALVTRTHTFAELARPLLENVLDMLDGRYPSAEFAELRPRIVWDRVAGTIRARKGARQLAIANAGTIPDRGLFMVTLPDGRRVGELDEEMVYEARPGQTFLLGASTWRIEEIGRDRVIVTPAPGVPGAVPFWKGDSVGRPKELGRAIGEFSAWAVDASAETLQTDYDLDERAARNLIDFLAEQQAATRVIPSDRTIVIERFRDEIGDWRLCVLSPYGARVHAAWGLAIGRRIREQFDLESDAIWSDDGIIVHLPDADEPPGAELVMVEPDEVEEMVVAELGSSALFGARFRENAARALLLPRARPGKRTPLWQQRLKAQSLLEVAKRYADFPIILETYRECLRDVLDLPGLHELLTGLHSRELSLVEVETQTASPFASSLLFDYVATYMYEGDAPNAERRAAALSLDRDLLRELLGQDELRDLIDPGALEQRRGRSPAPLRAHPGRHPRRPRRGAAATGRPARRRGPPARARAAGLRRDARPARGRAPRDPAARRARGALGRGRRRRPVPRRARGDPARRSARGVPGRRARRADQARRPLRPHARAVHDGRRAGPLRRRPDGPAAAARARRRAGPRRAAARAAPSASGAIRRCCAACAARRWPSCATRSRRAIRVRWPRSRRPGTASPATAAPAPASTACARSSYRSRASRCPPTCGSATCCRGASARTRRRGWTSCAPAARSCGSGRARWAAARAASHCTSAPTRRRSGHRRRSSSRRASRPTSPCASASPRRRASSPTCWPSCPQSPQEIQEALWDLVWAGEATNDAWAPLRAPRLTVAQRPSDSPAADPPRCGASAPVAGPAWASPTRRGAGR